MELDLKYRALLGKAGFMACNYGLADEAKQIFEEVLRLDPTDRQVKFLLTRINKE